MTPQSRVLVTGATGFVGSRVVERLRSAGHDVVTTDRGAGVDHPGDLADAAFVSALPDVDIVVHTAAVQYVSSDLPLLRRQGYFDRNNVVATGLLASRYGRTVQYFLNIGTSMMFDQQQPGPYGVGSALRGQGVYSRSKLEAYAHLKTMTAPNATLVPCIIGGKGREGLFRGFVATIRNRGFAICPGPGTHATHIVHVDDIADLITLLVRERATGLFPAGGPEPLTIRQWITVIADELAVGRTRLVRIPYPLLRLGASLTRFRILAREQLVMLGRPHELDTSRARALGWQPKWSNEEIVRDIARYMAANPVAPR